MAMYHNLMTPSNLGYKKKNKTLKFQIQKNIHYSTTLCTILVILSNRMTFNITIYLGL